MGRLLHAPIKQILRNPNASRDLNSAISNVESNLNNSISFLNDPKNDRKLVLIGSMNASDLLAYRTAKFLESYKPDSVLVQTNPGWYEHINKMVSSVQSNEDIYKVTKDQLYEHLWAPTNPRGLSFLLKFNCWAFIMRMLFPFHSEKVNPLLPGLEVYKAVEYATKNNKEIVFAEKALGKSTLNALKSEKRMNFYGPVLRNFIFNNQVTYWNREYDQIISEFAGNNFEDIAETYDDIKINLLNNMLERKIPYQKKVFIEKTDIRLFKNIYKMNGKNLFAVVNQWNKPGIEALWRHSTETEKEAQPINPIGDFDINNQQEIELVNEYLRRRGAKASKSEPAVTCNYILQYHKMTTEPERERHVFFDGYNDPELEHGLYNDENKGVKNLPYKLEEHH